MKIIGIIPARYASTRFPGKPLTNINGKTMIQRVYEQTLQAQHLNGVMIATDDERIYNHVLSFGGKVMMTAAFHQTGTDRCMEIAGQLQADAYINIQGDEPFIKPEQIDLLAAYFLENRNEIAIATLIKKTSDEAIITNPNVIKVVVNYKHEALYFSRSPIPFYRNKIAGGETYFKHIGMYGFTHKALKEITGLPMGELEKAESLEQLRWLANGYRIKTIETEWETHSIDTPEDLVF